MSFENEATYCLNLIVYHATRKDAQVGAKAMQPLWEVPDESLLLFATPILFHKMGERRYTHRDLADVWLVEVGLGRLYGDIVLFYCMCPETKLLNLHTSGNVRRWHSVRLLPLGRGILKPKTPKVSNKLLSLPLEQGAHNYIHLHLKRQSKNAQKCACMEIIRISFDCKAALLERDP